MGTLKDVMPKELLDKAAENKLDNNNAERKSGFNNRRGHQRPLNIVEANKIYPQHIVNLVSLLKSNSDIRRYTSFTILNYLSQKGIIEDSTGYVQFNWKKFRVTNHGISVEYRYTNTFFLNCLIASFTCFANKGQRVIAEYCSKEFPATFVQDDAEVNKAIDFGDSIDDNKEEETPEE